MRPVDTPGIEFGIRFEGATEGIQGVLEVLEEVVAISHQIEHIGSSRLRLRHDTELLEGLAEVTVPIQPQAALVGGV